MKLYNLILKDKSKCKWSKLKELGFTRDEIYALHELWYSVPDVIKIRKNQNRKNRIQ